MFNEFRFRFTIMMPISRGSDAIIVYIIIYILACRRSG